MHTTSSNGAGTPGYVVGVDIGGTFTDCAVIAPDGSSFGGKVPTRPDDRARSFFESIDEAARKAGMSGADILARCERLVHGTTTGTNALITRNGAKLGMLTTAGHGDATYMMKGSGRLDGLRPDQVLDLPATDKPKPLVPRRMIREVVERIDFEGDVVVALDEQGVRSNLEALVAEGVDAIAVSLLWSTRNHAHEERIAELVREVCPDVYVSHASALSARVGEYERTMTAIVNAYIGPLMMRYVDAIEEGARERGYGGRVLYSQCAGGAITAEEAREAPVRTVHSGPVSGVLGSTFLAERMGERNVIVTDMGGTSFDVSVVRDAAPDVRETSLIERFQVSLPMVFVDTVGAGGGSIAWIDEAGGLQVGPQSAGADPGPACYGRGGTQATVTDADVVLGIIDPDHFLHGAMKLDREAAERAVGEVGAAVGLDVHEAAAGINQIIDAKMADLLRRMSVLRGLDPRDFTCFAYGGSGPVHAGMVTRDIGVKRLVVPLLHVAPVWSAFGAAVSQVSHVYQRWEMLPMPAPAAAVEGVFEALESNARDQLRSEGFDPERIELERFVHMKYTAQVHDVEVPVAAGAFSDAAVDTLQRDFERVYDSLHGEGSGYREGGSQITGFTVRSRGVSSQPTLAAAQTEVESEWDSRPVYWAENGGFTDTPVLRTTGALADQRLEGPMLIELPDTVVVLRPGHSATFDELGSLVIDL